MRESRTYGSVRGAYDETHVPTATSLQTGVSAQAVPGRGRPFLLSRPHHGLKPGALVAAGLVGSLPAAAEKAFVELGNGIRVLVRATP